MLRFLRAYQRRIVSSLVLTYAAFLLIHPDEEGRAVDLIFFALLVTFIASQFFWIGRVVGLGERFLPGKPRRAWLAIVAGLIYFVVFIYSYPSIESTNAHIFRRQSAAQDLDRGSVLVVVRGITVSISAHNCLRNRRPRGTRHHVVVR